VGTDTGKRALRGMLSMLAALAVTGPRFVVQVILVVVVRTGGRRGYY
jgi:hypothetical protein